jgi:hypothetical protein
MERYDLILDCAAYASAGVSGASSCYQQVVRIVLSIRAVINRPLPTVRTIFNCVFVLE